VGPFGYKRHRPKSGGLLSQCCAPFHGRAGSPSNTMWPGPRPTSVPSGILIHPSVWPQQTTTTTTSTTTVLRPHVQDYPGEPVVPKETFTHVWPQQTCAKNWEGVAVPLFGGAESPSNTMWARPRPISVPSGIFSHPSAWPQ